MAFLKFAKAVVQKVNIPGKEWEGITARAGRDTFSDRTSKVAIQNYHPDKYLLTHSTIICSVDTEEPPNVKVGEVTEGSRKINRKYADYWITPETLDGINSNMDAWERKLLLATYRTFIGAENYCFAPDTKVLMADGSYKPIVDVVVGDEVITHTGKVKPVVHKFVRDYVGTVEEVYVGRFEKPIVATPNHPFYHLNVEAPEATRYNGSKKSSSDRYYKDQITSFLRGGETCLGGRLAGLKSIVTCLKEFPDSTNKEIQQKTGLQQSCIDAYFRKYPDAFSSRVLKKGEMPEVKGKPRRARRWSLSDESSLPVMEIKVEVKKSPISDINESTFLVSPAYIPSTQERVGLDRAVLLGYYMAEGCQSHPTKDKGIVLSFGPHEESLADDAIERLNRAFPTAKVSKVRTDTTLAVKANDSDTAKWFRDKGGHLAPHKRLSPDVLTWSQEELLWLISSWVTGDGNIHTETSRIRGATTSEQLAYQMRHVADLCGIKSTVVFEPQEIGKVSGSYEYTRLDGTSVNSPIICRNHLWNLVVSSGSINKIIEHSKRWDGISYEKTTKRSEFSRWDNHRVFPVSRKEQKKYAGKVYNIEVADDHSYVVDYGVAVANCEHIQVPELSKGKIIDAVARDLGDHIYVDILTATDRKHTQLVKDIESGKMAAMSMGCTIQYSQCTKCGNVAHDETDLCFRKGTRVLMDNGCYLPIEDVVPGDMVITHRGNTQQVLANMNRSYDGNLTLLNVDGVPQKLAATPNHPFWTLRPRQICACGCGEALSRTVEHRRGSSKSFLRNFRKGHYTRVHNPNPNAEKLLSKDDFEDLKTVEFEFVPAGEIQKGDYLAYPIPKGIENNADASIAKARLIGYFLAEGSFIKRDGVKVGVTFTFGHHEELTLAEETRQLLDDTFGGADHRSLAAPTEHYTKLCERNLIKPIRRRINSREVPDDVECPSCNAPSTYAYNCRFAQGRDDCYQCKVCSRQWIQGADNTVQARKYMKSINGVKDSGTCSVVMLSRQAAEFFDKYCGEYSWGKKLDASVMKWDPEFQRNILNCWLGGDGSQTSRLTIRGGTTSFPLLSQMHFLSARCRLYARRDVTFENTTVELDDVVAPSGLFEKRDSRGWLPSSGLHIHEPKGFKSEVRFDDQEGCRVTLSEFTDEYKIVGDWLLYRVRDTSQIPYTGTVYNLEVAEDHSYVVEGVAVHNCDHIRYEKGNTFIRPDGKKGVIAELCGHSDDPDSVQFIEASWVENPAFKGAVTHNILNMGSTTIVDSEEFQAKIKSAFENPSQDVDWTSFFQKTARQEAVRMLKKAFDFDEGGEEEGGSETTEEGLLDEVKNQIKDKVKNQIIKDLKNELSDKEEKPRIVPEQEEHLNENMIQSSRYASFKQKYASHLGSRTKTAYVAYTLLGRGTLPRYKHKFANQDLVAAHYLYDHERGNGLQKSLYKALYKVGGVSGYKSAREFVSACSKALGRQPTKAELVVLIKRAKTLNPKG